jgi:Dolichyl-phosphate-mannose-protein mannosyltransferase
VQHAATDSLTLQAEAIPAARVLDALALYLLAVTGIIAFATFRDYGLGWDDYTHSQYGALLIDLYKSGFKDQRALSFVNLYMYGGGFDMIATLAAKVLPFGLFETRRLIGAIIGVVGMFATWRLGRRLGGPFAGLIALALIATCPLYYGHMFINAKDGPFAAVMAIALLGLTRAFEEYPRPTPATLALCGIGFGLSIGARVLGGFALMEAVFPLPLILAIRARASGWKPALAECGTFLVPFIPTAVFAYLLMGLVWPWGAASPLNPFRAVEYFSSVFEKPWRELFAGQLIPVDDMPRSYVPTLFALQVPELMLLLGICGLVGVLIFVAKSNDNSAAGAGRRAAFFAVILAATLPILIAVATRPVVYNGIRHIVFVMPPFAALGGLAAAWIAQRLQVLGKTALVAGSLALLAGLVSPIVDMARVHPFEYTDYNHIAGGVQGARKDFMLDYWGLSFKQASQKLAAYVRTQRSAGRDRVWTIAVCGPHPPVAVALGTGKYNIVWDPKGADFAMVLGEFYCAKLDAPVLFDVVRDGVTYARVYDLRGRDVTSLLTVPGIDKTNY